MWPSRGLGSEDVELCDSVSLNPSAKESSVSDTVSSGCFNRKVAMFQKALCRQPSLDHSTPPLLYLLCSSVYTSPVWHQILCLRPWDPRKIWSVSLLPESLQDFSDGVRTWWGGKDSLATTSDIGTEGPIGQEQQTVWSAWELYQAPTWLLLTFSYGFFSSLVKNNDLIMYIFKNRLFIILMYYHNLFYIFSYLWLNICSSL